MYPDECAKFIDALLTDFQRILPLDTIPVFNKLHDIIIEYVLLNYSMCNKSKLSMDIYIIISTKAHEVSIKTKDKLIQSHLETIKKYAIQTLHASL